MKEKKLHNIKKTGFKTPDDYFFQVEEQILNEINLKNTVNSTGFELPEDYLDKVESQIMNKVSTETNPKVISLFTWKKVIYATAIAASILLMFNLVFNTSETLSFEDIEMASIASYLEEGDYTSTDLATLLTEEELNSLDQIESKISTDAIEDYLLKNATIEDLIID